MIEKGHVSLECTEGYCGTQEMFNTVGNAVSKLMGYHVECGDIMSTAGGFITLRDTMSEGDIMSMLGGCSVHWGFHTNLIVSPMILPTFIMIAPSVLTISLWCTEHPQCTQHPPLYCTDIMQGDDDHHVSAR